MSLNSKQNRLIAFDLDGTLFNRDGELSERTLRALSAANAADYTTIAVTGRSWRTAFERLRPAPGIDYIVCSNGAYLYRQSVGRVSWENTISRENTVRLVSTIRESIPNVCFGWESESGFYFEPAFRALATNPLALEAGGKATELGSTPVYKIFARTPDLQTSELLASLSNELAGHCEISTSGAPFVEMTAAGTDKSSGLSRVAQSLGILAGNTTVFGDNLNDVPMFKWAGTSVAMGNALPEVRSLATHTTVSHQDDGVAVFLEQLIFRG